MARRLTHAGSCPLCFSFAAARDVLAIAVDTYRQLGAVPSLNRARSRLRDVTVVARP